MRNHSLRRNPPAKQGHVTAFNAGADRAPQAGSGAAVLAYAPPLCQVQFPVVQKIDVSPGVQLIWDIARHSPVQAGQLLAQETKPQEIAGSEGGGFRASNCMRFGFHKRPQLSRLGQGHRRRHGPMPRDLRRRASQMARSQVVACKQTVHRGRSGRPSWRRMRNPVSRWWQGKFHPRTLAACRPRV